MDKVHPNEILFRILSISFRKIYKTFSSAVMLNILKPFKLGCSSYTFLVFLYLRFNTVLMGIGRDFQARAGFHSKMFTEK